VEFINVWKFASTHPTDCDTKRQHNQCTHDSDGRDVSQMITLCTTSKCEQILCRLLMPKSQKWIQQTNTQTATRFFNCNSNRVGIIVIIRAIKDRKPHQGQNGIWDTNRDFRINPDPDVCQIDPKMLWINYSPVGTSHFANYRKNWPVTVWEMLISPTKIHYSAMVKKIKSDPESKCGSGSTPKVYHF